MEWTLSPTLKWRRRRIWETRIASNRWTTSPKVVSYPKFAFLERAKASSSEKGRIAGGFLGRLALAKPNSRVSKEEIKKRENKWVVYLDSRSLRSVNVWAIRAWMPLVDSSIDWMKLSRISDITFIMISTSLMFIPRNEPLPLRLSIIFYVYSILNCW